MRTITPHLKVGIIVLLLAIITLNSFAQITINPVKDPSRTYSPIDRPMEFPISCSPISATSCNYIQNNDFTPSVFPPDPDIPFNLQQVLPWQPGSATCAIFPGTNCVINPPAGVNSYVFGGAGFNGQVTTESIVQKIPAVIPGHTYVLSFFISHRDYSPWFGIDHPLDHFHMHLINCDDYNATFHPEETTYQPIPVNSQEIYCQDNVANHAWDRVFVHFVAQQPDPSHPLNMLWIWPEEHLEMDVYSGMFVALPELIDISDYTNQVQQGLLPSCMATLPSCGPFGSMFNWVGPGGFPIISSPAGTPVTLDVTNPQNVGTWTLTLSVPSANITAGNCNTTGSFTTTVEVYPCQTAPPCTNTISCTPVNLNGCNYSSNGDFDHLPGYDPGNPAHVNQPFRFNFIPNWVETHGSPQIYDEISSPLTVPPPTVAGYSYLFSTGPGFQGSNVVTGDGIAEKIPSLVAGNSYSMTFFKKFIKPVGATPVDMENFYVVLMHCSDYPLVRTCNNSIADFPPNSQVVYCENNMSNTSWEQSFFCFSANDNYDMVWVFPKQSSSVLYNNGAGASGVDFTGLEFINTTNFNAGPQPVALYPNCTVTIGPTTPNCGVRNAVFNWITSNGTIIPAQPNQQLQVSVSNYYAENYTLEMSVPTAVYVELPCTYCTICKTVKMHPNSVTGGNCSLSSSLFIPPCSPDYNVYSCTPITSNQCNQITNNNFAIDPGYPPFMNVTPFNYNIVNGWKQSHGDPRLNVGGVLSPFGNTSVGMKLWVEIISKHPFVTKKFGDGLLVKIPKLIIGNSYALSFFIQAYIFPFVYPQATSNQFRIKLLKCSSLANYNMPTNSHELPNFQGASQDVFCLDGIGIGFSHEQLNTWKQLAKCFTANDEWDVVWISPGEKFGTIATNGDPVKDWYLLAEPELINLSNFTAGTPVNLGGGLYRIGPNTPNCGIRNATFSWLLPGGTEIPATPNQQMIVNNPGSYTLKMKMPLRDPLWYFYETCNPFDCTDITASTLVQRPSALFVTNETFKGSSNISNQSVNGMVPGKERGQNMMTPGTSTIQSLEIYNSAGQLLKKISKSIDAAKILDRSNAEGVLPGLYFIRIFYNDKTVKTIKKILQ